MKDKIVIGALMFLVGIAIGQAVGILPALAANPLPSNSTFDLVPFRGHIEKDGGPYSTSVRLRFRLYEVDAVDIDPSDDVWFYQETFDAVVPAEGNFAVVLGVNGQAPGGGTLKLSVALRDQPLAYAGIAVDDNLGGGLVELTGRQRLASAPFGVSSHHAEHGVPPGTVVAFSGTSVPDGWLLCNGDPFAQAAYPRLFTAIGTTYGSTSGTDFKVPDYRGRFLRGNNPGAGIDAGRVLGSNQDWSTGFPRAGLTTGPPPPPAAPPDLGAPPGTTLDGAHNHGETVWRVSRDFDNDGNGYPWHVHPNPVVNNGTHWHTIKGGDAETRPDNTSVNWIIKW